MGSLAGKEYWSSPALKDLYPDLCRDEQLRFKNPVKEGRRPNRQTKKKVEVFTPPRDPLRSEELRDSVLLSDSRHALRHYNARQRPGGELFDLVKPLMRASVTFRNQSWSHYNFWARSRVTNKIKRFFAEVHHDPSTDMAVRIVEICTIIEEPLNQYRSSCAFCHATYDILHPKGSRKFVCGNDKDRFYQRITTYNKCTGVSYLGRPFTCPSIPDALRIIQERDAERQRGIHDYQI